MAKHKEAPAEAIAGSETDQPPAPLPPLKASPIPQVELAVNPETGIDAGASPKDEDFTDGIFEMDGEKYALCIHDEDHYGRTHSCKNSVHFWQGSKEEFNASFNKI
jgi:hypothetical protein